MGTKGKFWYRDTSYGMALFKEGRPGTGEDWAEKVACELAQLMGLPHAHYELATCGERRGVIGLSLVHGDARLVHGNEVLSSFVQDYGQGNAKHYQRRGHTLRRVVGYFKSSEKSIGVPDGFQTSACIKTALDVFVGYLMFDAWIANQDRHDQNWAVVRASDGATFLSASYDHGSSMGRNEPDAKRQGMLTTKDRGQQVKAYASRALSALYPSSESRKALTTFAAFQEAAKHAPDAAKEWMHRLQALDGKQIDDVLQRIPQGWMSSIAKDFTRELLNINRINIVNMDIKP